MIVGVGDSAQLRQALTDIGVVVVGTAVRTDPLLIAGPYDPGELPLVVGDGVDAVASIKALELFGRHTDWVTSIDAERVVKLGVAGYLKRSAAVDLELNRAVGGTTLLQQTPALQDAATRAATSTRRFGLLGGIAAVLLLGFTVVAAAGLRREWTLLASTLRRRGATAAQVRTVTIASSEIVALAAAVFGALVGAAIAAVLSDGTGLSAVHVASAAVRASGWSVAVLVVAAVVVTVSVLLWPEQRSRAVWQTLDVIAVAALAAALLAAGRGSTSLSDSGDPLVAVLPVLAALVATIVAGRLWDPAAQLAARLLPRHSVAGRIALLGAIRRPLRPVATVALLAAAITCVVFAGGYRATLRQGAAEAAAHQVPL